MNWKLPAGGLRKALFFLPLLVLLADALLYGKGVAWIRSGLADPASGAVWFILGGYLLYILALPLSGLLMNPQEGSSAAAPDKRTRKLLRKRLLRNPMDAFLMFLGAGFGVIVVLLLAHALGLTGRQSPYSDNQQQAVIMGGALLAITHIAILAWKPRPRLTPDRPAYLAIELLALLVGSLSAWIAVAGWQHLLGGPDPVVRSGSRLPDMLIAFPLFLVFFSAPRFLFLRRNFNPYAFVGAMLLTVLYVWGSLEYVKIF